MKFGTLFRRFALIAPQSSSRSSPSSFPPPMRGMVRAPPIGRGVRPTSNPTTPKPTSPASTTPAPEPAHRLSWSPAVVSGPIPGETSYPHSPATTPSTPSTYPPRATPNSIGPISPSTCPRCRTPSRPSSTPSDSTARPWSAIPGAVRGVFTSPNNTPAASRNSSYWTHPGSTPKRRRSRRCSPRRSAESRPRTSRPVPSTPRTFVAPSTTGTWSPRR